jgi:predicted ATPase
MIKSIHFTNFKLLRNSELPLERFTIIIGPNGSGKTTAMHGLYFAGHYRHPFNTYPHIENMLSAGIDPKTQPVVQIEVKWETQAITRNTWKDGVLQPFDPRTMGISNEDYGKLLAILQRFQIFSLHAPSIIQATELSQHIQLGHDGGNLAVVLDQMRDRHPERFERLNEELGRWLPEFDRILFSTPRTGERAFSLRMRKGQHPIDASSISQGTILALTILTVAYLPDPPPIVCFEEPDRGLHPRLLRDVKEAMYRLSYPENYGEEREPVQVIATTHSPYMLDQYRDHPQEVVIAQKLEDNVKFERLSDRSDLDEILKESHLGDLWYSGILGGVPKEQ